MGEEVDQIMRVLEPIIADNNRILAEHEKRKADQVNADMDEKIQQFKARWRDHNDPANAVKVEFLTARTGKGGKLWHKDPSSMFKTDANVDELMKCSIEEWGSIVKQELPVALAELASRFNLTKGYARKFIRKVNTSYGILRLAVKSANSAAASPLAESSF